MKKFKVPKTGYWNGNQLRAIYNRRTRKEPKDLDLCELCNHPRFMHNHSDYLGTTFCKVHSCRHNEGCKRFKLKRSS